MNSSIEQRFPSANRSYSRGLEFARLAWAIVVLFALGVGLLSLPIQYRLDSTPCISTGCEDNHTDQLSQAQARQLDQAHLSLSTYAVLVLGRNVLYWVVFLAVGAIIMLRKSTDWMGLYVSLFLISFGTQFMLPTASDMAAYNATLFWPTQAVRILGNVLIVLFFFLFPDGHLVPRWMAWVVPLLIAREVLDVLFPDNSLISMLFFATIPLGIGAIAYRYTRVSDIGQRQQTKWVVFGMSAAVSSYAGLILVIGFLAGGTPSDAFVKIIGGSFLGLFLLLIPLSIGAAILRYRLFDIDIIIRRTLVYVVLTALLAIFYVGSVVLLQEFFRGLTGQSSDLTIIISTLGIAALSVPLRNRVQRAIDHRFYRRKYDAARVLAAFAATVRDEVDLERLTGELQSVVEETMQPEQVSVWLRDHPGPVRGRDRGQVND